MGFSAGSGLVTDGAETIASPAFRLGAQQFDKFRAAGDLKGSLTNEAVAVRAPINLPLWDHIAQLRDLFRLRGDGRPVDMAKAEHADDYKRLPLLKSDELGAVFTLQTQWPNSRMASAP